MVNSENGVGNSRHLNEKTENKFGSHHITFININSKWIVHLNIRCKTIKILRET
jgi:phage FluMu gp28-like protein